MKKFSILSVFALLVATSCSEGRSPMLGAEIAPPAQEAHQGDAAVSGGLRAAWAPERDRSQPHHLITPPDQRRVRIHDNHGPTGVRQPVQREQE